MVITSGRNITHQGHVSLPKFTSARDTLPVEVDLLTARYALARYSEHGQPVKLTNHEHGQGFRYIDPPSHALKNTDYPLPD